ATFSSASCVVLSVRLAGRTRLEYQLQKAMMVPGRYVVRPVHFLPYLPLANRYVLELSAQEPVESRYASSGPVVYHLLVTQHQLAFDQTPRASGLRQGQHQLMISLELSERLRHQKDQLQLVRVPKRSGLEIILTSSLLQLPGGY